MSQKRQILKYMREHGVITPLIAWRMGISALSQRCGELEREDGHVLSRIWVQRRGKRFRGYSLVA